MGETGILDQIVKALHRFVLHPTLAVYLIELCYISDTESPIMSVTFKRIAQVLLACA